MTSGAKDKTTSKQNELSSTDDKMSSTQSNVGGTKESRAVLNSNRVAAQTRLAATMTVQLSLHYGAKAPVLIQPLPVHESGFCQAVPQSDQARSLFIARPQA